MTLTDDPGPSDVVVGDRDATVLIGPVAAERLGDKVLDARCLVPVSRAGVSCRASCRR